MPSRQAIGPPDGAGGPSSKLRSALPSPPVTALAKAASRAKGRSRSRKRRAGLVRRTDRQLVASGELRKAHIAVRRWSRDATSPRNEPGTPSALGAAGTWQQPSRSCARLICARPPTPRDESPVLFVSPACAGGSFRPRSVGHAGEGVPRFFEGLAAGYEYSCLHRTRATRPMCSRACSSDSKCRRFSPPLCRPTLPHRRMTSTPPNRQGWTCIAYQRYRFRDGSMLRI